MHGGVKFYRGCAKAARNYVEADRSRADDYYLAEGTGIAQLYAAGPDGRVVNLGGLDGDGYEQWVGGYDTAGVAKGRLRTDEKGLRFVEVVVNGPKTWSLAASVDPDIADALDAAQDRAAEAIIGWVAQHATTRVGPRGRQVQIGVDRIEAAVVRHYTSRAGDPHRHLHLQINARVHAAGKWRGLHSVGIVDSIEAINGIGHATVACDPEFRSVLAAKGYTIDPDTGGITQLAPFAPAFSHRADQITRHVDRYEAQWRREHPGDEPGPTLRRAWDRRAWAQARPDKVVPLNGTDLAERWREELHDHGFRPPSAPTAPAGEPAAVVPVGTPIGRINPDAVTDLVLTRLGARRSAWNSADIRGEVERIIATIDVIASPSVRTELAEDLTARTTSACRHLLAPDGVPEHIRSLTSNRVLTVEAELVDMITRRGNQTEHTTIGQPPAHARTRQWRTMNNGTPPTAEAPAQAIATANHHGASLDPDQTRVVAALTSQLPLIVVEGAAGAGKTTTLAATADALAATHHRLMVVTPTMKAAHVAETELTTRTSTRTGSEEASASASASSAAWLIHQYGFRWDADGKRHREPFDPTTDRHHLDHRARLLPGDLLVIDEAGMVDQDTAHALFTIAEETGARIALVGDRHQLPAVGRGGLLDHATRWTPTHAQIPLTSLHRFTDPDYADLTLHMRTGTDPGAVFDQLHATGRIVIHPSEVERTHTLCEIGAREDRSGRGTVIADTRQHVSALNAGIRDHLHQQQHQGDTRRDAPDPEPAARTHDGEPLAVGDRITTRRNDRDLDIANRDHWTITHTHHDGRLDITGRRGIRTLPAGYVATHVELAYATTVHGAQGETVDHAHFAPDETTGAAATYVAMTRGRHSNTAHLVADTPDQARQQWITALNRDRADLGPAHARQRALDDIDRYGTTPARAQASTPEPPTAPAPPAAARRRHLPPPPPPASPASRPASRPGHGIAF